MSLEHHAERAPFPILSVLRDGRITWANDAAAPLLQAWGTAVGESVPAHTAERVALVASQGQDLFLDQVIGGRAWELHLCPSAIGDRVRLFARDRSKEAEAEALLIVADRAPALSPDPILRVLPDGLVAWGNAAAQPLLEHWQITRGDRLPAEWIKAVRAVYEGDSGYTQVLETAGAIWAVRFVADVDVASVFLFATHRPLPDAADTGDNFVANMGHELRTPLNAVVGYAELVQDELRSHGLDQAVADLDKIRSSAAQLRALIDDMVDLAKLQANRIALSPSTFYIADLVDDVLVQVASKAERNDNSLEAEVTADPEHLRADAVRLRQILAALLDNACKFTEGGTIRLEVSDTPDQVAFRVVDTGIGLSGEQLATLFRPYAQVDGSATRKYGGTGLGLAIARMLARRMGGDITVRSERGTGSTFTVLLPREAAE